MSLCPQTVFMLYLYPFPKHGLRHLVGLLNEDRNLAKDNALSILIFLLSSSTFSETFNQSHTTKLSSL